ncbi:hypothetical protein VTN00DRAFT_8143 [Thermoascus crustaceus]|uniref:uncharacterized protein n=1 Tax=Thermoascus crustaceus TaxID=5088 RepID=UPI0037438CC4
MTSKSASPSGEFRQYLPDLSTPRFTTMCRQNAREYAHDFLTKHNPPWLYGLYLHWRKLFKEPFRGVTSDGKIKPGLFQLQDEGLPIEKIVAAAQAVLSKASPAQRDSLLYHIDSPEWRSWSNPEFLLSDKGLRLDDLEDSSLRDAILAVLAATLSPEGYEKALAAMRINHFLGELVKSPAVMNEFSYNFVVFGTPSTERPWGWSFYGHHLCLNVFLVQRQIVISPWFTGAEPNEIDDGPYAGTRILHVEERLGLQLMQSLPPQSQQQAQIYKQMRDPAMQEGRWNRDDQRHLCGAYRDNRVVPYEGVIVSGMDASQQNLVWQIVEQYLLYLPESSRRIKLEQVRSFADETYFSWIGGFETDKEPFYYRIQSPVIIIEFDHHSGVFLTNEEPAKFHIHTLLRTPNGGDYGYALRPLIPSIE